MNYDNPYVRLQTYLTLLSNNEAESISLDHTEEYNIGMSMNLISRVSGIPIGVVRADFCCLLKWNDSLSAAEAELTESYPDDEEYDSDHGIYSPDSIIRSFDLNYDDEHESYKKLRKQYPVDELLEQFSEETEKLMLQGVFDDLPFFVQAENPEKAYVLNLTGSEMEAFQSFLTESGQETHKYGYSKWARSFEHSLQIKDRYTGFVQYHDIHKMLQKLNRAILNRLQISFTYAALDGIHFLKGVQPIRTAYDSDEHLYSLIALHEGEVMTLRLDRVQSDISISSKQHFEPDSTYEHVLKIAPGVWGNSFRDDPVTVKVRFYNEANVWKKVRMDLECRTNGRLYEEDGFLYYEDTVYGISRFRRWLYGYGSSAVVLEPESLRNNIIESLKSRLS